MVICPIAVETFHKKLQNVKLGPICIKVVDQLHTHTHTFATACAVCCTSFVVLLEKLELSRAGFSISSICETLFLTSARTFSSRGLSFFIAAFVWACRRGHSLTMSEWRLGKRKVLDIDNRHPTETGPPQTSEMNKNQNF